MAPPPRPRPEAGATLGSDGIRWCLSDTSRRCFSVSGSSGFLFVPSECCERVGRHYTWTSKPHFGSNEIRWQHPASALAWWQQQMELFSISEAPFVCRAHCLRWCRPWMFYLRAIAARFSFRFCRRKREERSNMFPPCGDGRVIDKRGLWLMLSWWSWFLMAALIVVKKCHQIANGSVPSVEVSCSARSFAARLFLFVRRTSQLKF